MGFLLLALLGVLLLGYVHLTNDRRIRRQAERELERMTGCLVSIHEAHFSLFNGVKLSGLQVRLPEDPSPKPFLHAEHVLIRHRPWSLVTHRRLVPVEIICFDTTVTNVIRPEGISSTEQLAMQSDVRFAGGLDGPLPTIRVRDGRLHTVVAGSDMDNPAEVRLNMAMVPAGESSYRVSFMEPTGTGGGERVKGSALLELGTGEVSEVSGYVPASKLGSALPPEYARKFSRWLEEGLNVPGGFEPVSVLDEEGLLRVRLSDLSMRLKDVYGKLGLSGIEGEILFDEEGVTLEDIRGTIPAAGGARFRIWGRYRGHEPESPFTLKVEVAGMVLPERREVSGPLLKVVSDFDRFFAPEGSMDISATLERSTEGGEVDYRGILRPQEMTVTFHRFPYTIDGVKGEIAFNTEGLELKKIIGRRGKATVEITGTVADTPDNVPFDVAVVARDLPLDEHLRKALPRDISYPTVWEDFGPSGRLAEARAHIWHKTGGREHANVTLSFDGRAAATFHRFPYRLEKLTGRVKVTGRTVELKNIGGRRGEAVVRIDGEVVNPGRQNESLELDLSVEKLPLDDALRAALQTQGREMLAALNASGTIDTGTAEISQSAEGELDFRIDGQFTGLTLRPQAFPYTITHAAGDVTITPRRVLVGKLSGRHASSAIEASGQFILHEKDLGVDLAVSVKNLLFDKELHAALPDNARAAWARLNPRGRANLQMTYRDAAPDPEDAEDYTITLDPRGMSLKYEDFPYPLENVTGTAVIRPDGVTLKDFQAGDEKQNLTLDGTVAIDADVAGARFTKVRARNLPIDETLMAASPPALANLLKRFGRGGTLDVALKRLTLSTPGPRTRPAASPATAPATGPSDRPLHWSLEGRIGVEEASADLGFGTKKLTGAFTGTMGNAGEGLAIDGAVEMDRIRVGSHTATELSGKFVKRPSSSLLRIEKLTGKAYKGKLAGRAEVRLGEKVSYGLRLACDAVRLEALAAAGGAAEDDIAGRLTGELRLVVPGDLDEQRQGVGTLKISRGKLYRLPVMLGFLHVIYLSLPGDAAFTDGEVRYRLKGDTLIFEEIYLRGSALSVVGSGTLGLQKETLDLTFMAGPPQKIPRMSELDDLVKILLRELLEIRVTGTLSKPRMRTVSLKSLEGVAKKLLNPGSGSG